VYVNLYTVRYLNTLEVLKVGELTNKQKFFFGADGIVPPPLPFFGHVMRKEVGGVGMTACCPKGAGRKGKDHSMTKKIGKFVMLRLYSWNAPRISEEIQQSFIAKNLPNLF
jgi:hypothetical protein